MIVQGATLLAGLYGALKGHQHQTRMENALDEQTGVLKEQLDVIRSERGGGHGAGDGDGQRGNTVDELV